MANEKEVSDFPGKIIDSQPPPNYDEAMAQAGKKCIKQVKKRPCFTVLNIT